MIDVHDGKVVIFIGDEDVLMGTTAAMGAVRVWFAPLPPDHGLVMNEPTPHPDTRPPETTVAKLFFVNRAGLDGFITMLTAARDKAFPEEQPGAAGT